MGLEGILFAFCFHFFHFFVNSMYFVEREREKKKKTGKLSGFKSLMILDKSRRSFAGRGDPNGRRRNKTFPAKIGRSDL